MHIEFQFYGTLRDAVGEKTLLREFDDGTTLVEAIREVADEYDDLQSLLFRSNGELRSHITVALNGDPLNDDADREVALSDGDTLVLSPGFSGGSNVKRVGAVA